MKFLTHDGTLYFWTKIKAYVDGKYNELFQSVSNGKTTVANAITDKGIATNATDTFATMANNISLIQTGVNTTDANASASDLLSGKTAYVNEKKITGVIPLNPENTGTGHIECKNSFTYGVYSNDGVLRLYMRPTSLINQRCAFDKDYWFTIPVETLGITADKIVVGQSILGVSGTGRASWS